MSDKLDKAIDIDNMEKKSSNKGEQIFKILKKYIVFQKKGSKPWDKEDEFIRALSKCENVDGVMLILTEDLLLEISVRQTAIIIEDLKTLDFFK